MKTSKPLYILVACEESQAVTMELRKLGHYAYSCDIQEQSGGHPEWHFKQDVFEVLAMKAYKWDMLIAFPPCTYLAASGLHWNKRQPERAKKTEAALEFVRKLLNADVERIALENSIGRISTAIRKPDQIIQPYQFGHDASKATCLWLKNLPVLQATKKIPGRMVDGKERWGNQTDSGQNKLGPGPNRSKIRSKTYSGIAKAMAAQWAGVNPTPATQKEVWETWKKVEKDYTPSGFTIAEQFYTFPAGTNYKIINQWFIETFGKSLTELCKIYSK